MEDGRYFYTDGRRLQNEYAGGQVQVFINEDGSRATEIRVARSLVTVERAIIQPVMLRDYGTITVEGEGGELLLAIKKPELIIPYLIVEARDKVLGKAEGNRFDIALAYTLGISDPELIIDMQDTRIDPQISDAIASVIF